MAPFDRVHTTAYSTLIETMRVSCIVFDIVNRSCHLSKFTYFSLPHLQLAPKVGVTLVEFRGNLWHQKPWATVLVEH